MDAWKGRIHDKFGFRRRVRESCRVFLVTLDTLGVKRSRAVRKNEVDNKAIVGTK